MARRGAQLVDGPMGQRVIPKLAQQRFEARQALNRYKSFDREIATDVNSIVENLVTKKRGLTKATRATMLARIDELEEFYLPRHEVKSANIAPTQKARLTKALNNRHVISEDEIAAIDDGTPLGVVVADRLNGHHSHGLAATLAH